MALEQMEATAVKPTAMAPCALVVGLCSHGLAITRSLHRRGVEVHAFEANGAIPGALTRSARIHFVESIKTAALIDELVAFRQQQPADRPIVLFPTNDSNVRVIARHMDRLRGLYLLSWEADTELVQQLLLKSNIEQRCRDVGLNYPVSRVLDRQDTLATLVAGMRSPFIIKPANPQSSFKAIKCVSVAELDAVVERHGQDYPFIIQEWVSGTDKDLVFGALYLDRGKPLASFVGNKLQSHPPALGQTTVAISIESAEVETLTKRFFDGLDLSGPVSLEFKQDADGSYWVIEPTVGRTDFWVGLCIGGGCDLPYIEYCHAAGIAQPESAATPAAIWFDSERDVLAPWKYLAFYRPGRADRYRAVFSYFALDDLRPFFRAAGKASVRVLGSIGNRLRRRRQALVSSGRISSFRHVNELPPRFAALLAEREQQSIFLGPAWFTNFCNTVANRSADDVRFYCLDDGAGEALAILPMWRTEAVFHGVRVRKLSVLANYYSPIFDIIRNQERISRSDAYRRFLQHFWQHVGGWDLIDVHPICAEVRQDLLKEQRYSATSFDYFLTDNYYQCDCSSYAQYLAGRPSRLVNTLKRKSKKLHRLGEVNVRICSDPDEVAARLGDYHRIYHNSWKVDEPYPDFIDGLTRTYAERGDLRLGILEIDRQAVAVQLWLVANGAGYIYKLAYDKEFRAYSPGTILTAAMVENAIDVDRVTKIDFLTGQDAFKKDWMDASDRLYGVQIVNYRTLSGVAVFVINQLSKIRQKLIQMWRPR